METRLYDPFENLYLNAQTCFLTGEDLHSDEEQISVFPKWILDRYSLHDKKFVMMDQFSSFLYPDLKLPCSQAVINNAIDPLEKEIEKAFTAGYDEVIKVPEIRLFQWMGKMIYGVLYYDLVVEKKKAEKRNKEFKLSVPLKKRFRKLHLMLQSLVVPMEFKGINPWSIRIVKVKYSKDIFNYKDEPTNMNFSLGNEWLWYCGLSCRIMVRSVMNNKKLCRKFPVKHFILFSLKNFAQDLFILIIC